ncbi:EndoU domain-containing protein [Chromobacterium violaceum]|uniref:EndoU domain-containing protein n=1 Tax=Chromobacterium violaceum TaxID=536 RepID=UPI001C8C9905|nr:EndoU domain-containing protein [Chromobacterium violaceum]
MWSCFLGKRWASFHSAQPTALGPRVDVGDYGLYRVAPIEINGVVKKNGSTFSPDNWSASRVKYETFQAYSNRVVPDPENNPRFWTGISPGGIEIQGYLTPHLTAYPFQ